MLDNMGLFSAFLPEEDLIFICKQSVILASRGVNIKEILRRELKESRDW